MFKRKWIILIIIFAAILRLIYFFQIRNFVLFKYPVLDADVYLTWANNILQGDILSRKTGVFVLSPLYAYFMAFVQFIFGKNIEIIVLIQFILGLVNCILVYSIAKKMFNNKIALIAALFSALYSYSIYIEGMLLTAGLIFSLNLLAVYLLLKGYESKTMVFYSLSGLAVGLSSMLRPNVLLFAVFISVWFIMIKDLKKYLIFLLGIFIALSPLLIRNYIVNREFSPASASAGMNFYLGNNEHATGIYSPLDFDQADPVKQGENYRKKASEISKQELSHSEASRYWFKEGLTSIINKPLKWAGLMIKKTILCFHEYEIPMNYNYYFYKSRFPALYFTSIFSSVLIFPLGMLGFVLFFLRKSDQTGRNKSAGVIIIYFVSYIAALILFFVSSEYRYPIVFVLIIMSAYAVYELFERIRQKRFAELTTAVVVLLISVFISRFPVGLNSEKYQFGQEYTKLGAAYMKSGNIDEGIKSFLKGLEYAPSNADLYFNLGHAYLYEKKDYGSAVEKYSNALNCSTDIYTKEKILIELAEAYRDTKKLDEALNCYKKAIEINDKNHVVYMYMGNIYYILNKKEDAVKNWEKSLDLFPDNPVLKQNMEILRNKH